MSATTLRLDFSCGRCGTRPNIRIVPRTKERYEDDQDDEPVKTWRCQNCGEVHLITAAAYKGAN